MSSARSLKEFIRERLTAAAEEIFTEFDKTILQYEEELDRQRRLLEICWKPQINLERIDLPQHHAWKEDEVLTEQQFYNQDRNSSLDQEELEPLQIKEEREPLQIKEEPEEIETPQIKYEQNEFCISLDKEQHELKQEIDLFPVKPTDEGKKHRETEPNRDQSTVQITSKPENHDQEKCHHKDSGPSRDEELKQKRRHQQIKGLSDNVKKKQSKKAEENTHAKEVVSKL